MQSTHNYSKELLRHSQTHLEQWAEKNFYICPQNQSIYNQTISFFKSSLSTLVIYGESGSGKTQLISSALLHSNQEGIYIDSSELINIFYKLKKNKQSSIPLYNWFKSQKLLIFDSLQLIKPNTAINDFFCSLLESLRNRKIVLIWTSNEPISIPSSDLILHLPPPNSEDLRIIARKFLEAYNPNIKLKKNALDALITGPHTGISSLINQLTQGFFHLSKTEFPVFIGSREMERILLSPKSPDDSEESIIQKHKDTAQKICDKLNFDFNQLLQNTRKKEVVYQRNIVIYLLKKKYFLTHEEIGRIFNKNHSTVTHSIAQVEKKMNNEGFRKYLKIFL